MKNDATTQKEYFTPKVDILTLTSIDVMNASGDITNFDIFDDGYSLNG